MSLYKSYSAYRDSGINWLGKVPERWEIKPIKSLANTPGTCFIDGDWIESKNLSENGIRYITTGNVGSGSYKEQGTGYISEETFKELACTDVRQGDILLSRLNSPIGRACLIPDLGGRVVTSVDNVILRPSHEYLAQYIVYRFSAADYFHEMGLLASGTTMQRISRTEMGNVRVAWPSKKEQIAIVEHLDRETSRIDTLVEKKTRFIELLRGKRQALITHSVTKGLDPNAPMKDSGVAWLGAVPKHWATMPLQYVISRIEQGWSPECLSEPAEGEEWGVVKSSCINGGVFSAHENKKLPPDLAPRSEIAIKPGDILMSRASGSIELIGSVGLVPSFSRNLMFSDKIFRISTNRRITPQFFVLVMNSLVIRAQIANAISGAEGLANNLPQARIKKFWIVLPSQTEQVKIVKYVEDAVRRLDAVIAKTERSIELLRERRSALITAAVTGQIDVREAA